MLRGADLGMGGIGADQNGRREQDGFHWEISCWGCAGAARLGSSVEPSGMFDCGGAGVVMGVGGDDLPAGASSSRLQSIASSKRSEEHPSEPQALIRPSYAGFCFQQQNIRADTQPAHSER